MIDWTEKDYVDLLPDIVPDLRGAPKELIKLRLRDTIIEFARHSQAIQYQPDDITLLADVATYEIHEEIPDCHVLDKVIGVWRETRLLSEGADWFHQDKNTIRLRQAPSARVAGGLIVVVGLKPDLTATATQERFLEDWYEGIAHGTKWRMMQIPNKDWTNLTGAREHRVEYERIKGEARSEVSRKLGNALRLVNTDHFLNRNNANYNRQDTFAI